ncbi:MAG TPA: hypothetical protein VF659_08765 [Pyrinomonadaceae bacterium]|jgi:hypothetical protein
MKHRSVIAFVIVAAALFAAPQLSHDLQSFKSALGARLRGELMQAFLSLPAAEGAPAAAPHAFTLTQLVSCTKQRPAAKPRKTEPAAPPRAEARTAEPRGDQLAMIGEPTNGPGPLSAAFHGDALAGATVLPREAAAELAMIIPPDGGVDPRAVARVVASAAEAREMRAAYVHARFEGKRFEWRKAEEALRGVEGTLPGAYEFEPGRDASKAKVLKVKRVAGANCPAPAPCPPRPAGDDATAAPLPAPPVSAVTTFVGEE